MLEEIRVSDLGVIAHVAVPLGPGLTVLTGETGAGKTMLLEALGLLAGGRADSTLVRPGARRTLVEGRWRLPDGHPALARAAAAGAELDDDGTLLVVRTVSADGRSRCTAGGVGVPVSLLAELGEQLVAVHGQADQQRLAAPRVHRALLDRFAGPAAAELLVACRTAHAARAAAAQELAEVTGRARERALEADGLRHGLDAVRAVQPVAGEEAETERLVARLAHAESLAATVHSAHDALTEGDGNDARTHTAHAVRLVRDAAALDPGLAALAERLDEVTVLVEEAARDLASYAAGLVVDPATLQAAQERTQALSALVRRYAPGGDATALLAWADGAERRLGELDGGDERVAALQRRVEQESAALRDAAGRLTALRADTGARLSGEIGVELAALAMPAATVQVELAPTDPGPHGADQVTFTLAPHPGAPARPVSRGASGGERSRIMLALEVVLAAADPVPTLVFDEVDAGVGGQAAVEVGRRLARLGRSHQVLVVTHLAQVAAFADAHVRVVKEAPGEVAVSAVTVLDDAGRAAELARMIGAARGSRSALDHARELLALPVD